MHSITITEITPAELEALIERTIEKVLARRQKTTSDYEMGDALLNVKQAASFLHLSISTIYSKVCRNEIPYMKRGKRLYFTKQQLLEYVGDGLQDSNEGMVNKAHRFIHDHKMGRSYNKP